MEDFFPSKSPVLFILVNNNLVGNCSKQAAIPELMYQKTGFALTCLGILGNQILNIHCKFCHQPQKVCR